MKGPKEGTKEGTKNTKRIKDIVFSGTGSLPFRTRAIPGFESLKNNILYSLLRPAKIKGLSNQKKTKGNKINNRDLGNMGSRIDKTNRLVFGLVLMVVMMFGFSFALVPLYDVFCKVTGLNGKVDVRHPGVYPRYKVENEDGISRVITVEFDVNRHQDIRCEIKPKHTVMQIKPGELNTTSYYVKNLTDRKLVIQAIPSISPGLAARYLKKLECFCFTPQVLQPFESMDLPLRFWLEPEIPESVRRLTLSYTLFDVTNLKKETPRGS